MKQKDFGKLQIGDIVEAKKRRAKVMAIEGDLVLIEYLDTHYRVWKRVRQLK